VRERNGNKTEGEAVRERKEKGTRRRGSEERRRESSEQRKEQNHLPPHFGGSVRVATPLEVSREVAKRVEEHEPQRTQLHSSLQYGTALHTCVSIDTEQQCTNLHTCVSSDTEHNAHTTSSQTLRHDNSAQLHSSLQYGTALHTCVSIDTEHNSHTTSSQTLRHDTAQPSCTPEPFTQHTHTERQGQDRAVGDCGFPGISGGFVPSPVAKFQTAGNTCPEDKSTQRLKRRNSRLTERNCSTQ
jgi:hypothetical protein